MSSKYLIYYLVKYNLRNELQILLPASFHLYLLYSFTKNDLKSNFQKITQTAVFAIRSENTCSSIQSE